jgi:ABC-type transporter MlaC component
MDLQVNQQTQQQLAQINEAYKAIMADRLRVAAEADRQRILEEQRKLVAERTATILTQAKARNFRVKEETVNGKKRFTFVKMVIQ